MTLVREGGRFVAGVVLQKRGGFRGQGRGGCTPDTKYLNKVQSTKVEIGQMVEAVLLSWGGGVGGPPPRIFLKILHEKVNSGSITLIMWKSLNGYNFETVCPIFKIQKV